MSSTDTAAPPATSKEPSSTVVAENFRNCSFAYGPGPRNDSCPICDTAFEAEIRTLRHDLPCRWSYCVWCTNQWVESLRARGQVPTCPHCRDHIAATRASSHLWVGSNVFETTIIFGGVSWHTPTLNPSSNPHVMFNNTPYEFYTHFEWPPPAEDVDIPESTALESVQQISDKNFENSGNEQSNRIASRERRLHLTRAPLTRAPETISDSLGPIALVLVRSYFAGDVEPDDFAYIGREAELIPQPVPGQPFEIVARDLADGMTGTAQELLAMSLGEHGDFIAFQTAHLASANRWLRDLCRDLIPSDGSQSQRELVRRSLLLRTSRRVEDLLERQLVLALQQGGSSM